MPLHNEKTKDGGTGTESSREKRIIQNRLAQRTWRQRQSQLAEIATKAAGESAQQVHVAEPYRKQGQSVLRFPVKRRKPLKNKDEPNSPKPRTILAGTCGRTDLSLSPDHSLLTVVQNNVLRGFLSFMLPLQLTQAQITQEDSVSTFTLHSDDHWQRDNLLRLPPCLQPTSLQLAVTHHPWIDMLPCPKLRDNVLIALQSLSDERETELCEDIVGCGELQLSGHGPGLLVWGDSFHVQNWEISKAILEKWPVIFRGCIALLESSKLRRRQRGF